MRGRSGSTVRPPPSHASERLATPWDEGDDRRLRPRCKAAHPPPPAFDGRVLLSWTNTAGCGAACIPVATHAYNEQHHDYMAQAKLREGRSPAARAPACRHP